MYLLDSLNIFDDDFDYIMLFFLFNELKAIDPSLFGVLFLLYFKLFCLLYNKLYVLLYNRLFDLLPNKLVKLFDPFKILLICFDSLS
jgi:hypothetical protein